MGVLQRIGLAYSCAALLTQGRTVKQQVMTIAVLLYGYWFAMTLLPVPDTGAMGQLALGDAPRHHGRMVGSPAARLVALRTRQPHLGEQRDLGSRRHLLDDPGDLHGDARQPCRPMDRASNGRSNERLNGLFAAGALGMMAGLMWNWSFPINKSLWTSSYVMFSAGMAARGDRDDHVDRRRPAASQAGRSRSSSTA